MNTDSPSKWDEAIERKEAIVRRRAKVLLDDSSHDWLRTQRARRTLVVLYVTVTIAMGVLWVVSWDIPALLTMGAWVDQARLR